MFQAAKDWLVDKASGLAATGLQAGGTLAGNAVGGVGTLIESSGRNLGQSATGAIGGVGSYINAYGDEIKGSLAASGGGGSGSASAKKVAVKPAPPRGQATGKGNKNSRAAVGRNLPLSSATKRKPGPPAAAPAAVAKNLTTSSSRPAKPPPAAPDRNLPAKKPSTSSQPAKAVMANSRPPRIASSAADRTPDGKVRVSPVSRPQRAELSTVSRPSKPASGTCSINGPPKPLSRISAGKGDRTAEGKIKVHPASRSRPGMKAR